MAELWVKILSLPNIVIYAVICAAVAALVVGLGTLAFGKKSKFVGIASTIAVVATVQFLNVNLHRVRDDAVVTATISMLKDMRLGAVIFRIDPSAEGALSAKLKEIADTSPPEEILQRTQAASSQFFGQYLQRYMPLASEGATYKLLQRQVAVMREWQSHPIDCVGYYSGNGRVNVDAVPVSFMTDESNVRADVIESAFNSPSPAPKNPDLNYIIEELRKGYAAKGYDFNDVQKLQDIDALPPTEGCRAAIEIADVLATMEPKDAVYAFKGLMVLSEKPQ